MSSKRYAVVGIAVILVAVLFLSFSDDAENEGYDMSGIVHDIRSSTNGFTFYLDTVDDSIRCYSNECPADLGYYGVNGSLSKDGSIFFVDALHALDDRSEIPSSCMQHRVSLKENNYQFVLSGDDPNVCGRG